MDQTSVVAEFRWTELGEGQPVVLLHGLFGASANWEATMEALGPGHRAMALTLPIFELPADDLSVGSLRAHVEAFLDAERVGPAVLVGNSLGGHVALDLALYAPERVRGLVLTGSSGLFERTPAGSLPRRRSPDFIRQKMTEVFHDPGHVTPEWVEDILELMGRRGYALRALQISRSAREYNLEARLAEIRCPTLLIWGREDRITPPAVGHRFLRGIPHARLALIPECGHAPMLEQPEAFGQALDAFLEGLTADASAASRG